MKVGKYLKYLSLITSLHIKVFRFSLILCLVSLTVSRYSQSPLEDGLIYFQVSESLESFCIKIFKQEKLSITQEFLLTQSIIKSYQSNKNHV